MPTGREHRPRALGAAGRRAALLFLLLFQGVSGMAGGVGLVADASGSTLGIPLEWLKGSPFPDYLIPGMAGLALTACAMRPLTDAGT